ncbi:MAG: AIR synthase family protein [Candidatus Geothermarchaeales archaeon]
MGSKKHLPLGKVPPSVLRDTLFRFLGVEDKDVILGPKLGEDAAVVKMGEVYLVVSTDPITAAKREIGWLAVHISANDVAVTGARPRWFLSSLLLPDSIGLPDIEAISRQIGSAAKALGMAVIGGHTEVTPGLKTPIATGVAMGLTTRYVTSSGARPGDKIILSKGVGLEGVSILASALEDDLLRELPKRVVEEAKSLRERISVVSEAMALVSHEWLTAMHDPTEGGIFLGLHELADASSVGLKIQRDGIIVPEVVKRVCETLNVDVYSLLSSGTLVATVHPRHVDDALKTLSNIEVESMVIGEILEATEDRTLIDGAGNATPLPRPEEDAVWRLVEG